ncbi:hypothetical protein SDC9_166832 [bioreactor metagenome]|uniref:Uncharacterized protein n=1 Tax=bioreactor metagenome TaxID=1076179 RepID=A0A645G6B1_9ZZZZ
MYPALLAISIASKVSVIVPIWLTLTNIEFATPASIPLSNLSVLVTNKSSPTNCNLFPNLSVNNFHPSQSSSSNPSSIVIIGKFVDQSSYNSTISAAVNSFPSPAKTYFLVSLLYISVAATSNPNITSFPGSYPALAIASTINSKAALFDDKFGANPPSSPTPQANPLAAKTDFKEWNTSAPILKASLNEGAPTGNIMNS